MDFFNMYFLFSASVYCKITVKPQLIAQSKAYTMLIYSLDSAFHPDVVVTCCPTCFAIVFVNMFVCFFAKKGLIMLEQWWYMTSRSWVIISFMSNILNLSTCRAIATGTVSLTAVTFKAHRHRRSITSFKPLQTSCKITRFLINSDSNMKRMTNTSSL